MSTVTYKGDKMITVGTLPRVVENAPPFYLTGENLEELSLESLKGKKVILNIFPSLDTPVCAMSVRRFNQEASSLKNTVVLCISADLPFAQKRFCTTENLTNVIPLSSFRFPKFGYDYGVTIQDGPLAGLLSRAVVVLDEEGKIIYTQLVSEIKDEPDYAAALAALK
ncbi:MAG: thiol peroxidase [Alphaproteobacteria bacterium]|nr:thiol peroxidase [Alphaproteobacteria bacterium]